MDRNIPALKTAVTACPGGDGQEHTCTKDKSGYLPSEIRVQMVMDTNIPALKTTVATCRV